MRLALALLTLLLFAPAAAHAEWTGQTISSPHRFVDDPTVIVAGNGGVLAAWRYQQGDRAGVEGAARPAGAAGFGRRVALVPAMSINRPLTTLAGLAAYGDRRALMALMVPGPGDTPQARIGVRFGTIGGRFGRLRTIRRA